MTQIDYVRILQDFATNEATKYDLRTPFRSIGTDWIAATDGRMVAWVSVSETGMEVPKEVEVANTPDMRKAVPEIKGSGKTFKVADLHDLALEKEIALYALPMIECSYCSGKGFCECQCGDEHDCGTCEGEGKIDDPKKPEYPPIFKTFKPAWVDYRYIDKIRRACIAANEPEIRVWVTDAHNTIRMRAGHLNFVVMPLRQPVKF